jgi:hypothetical protein
MAELTRAEVEAAAKRLGSDRFRAWMSCPVHNSGNQHTEPDGHPLEGVHEGTNAERRVL